jgi:hypothetical protein
MTSRMVGRPGLRVYEVAIISECMYFVFIPRVHVCDSGVMAGQENIIISLAHERITFLPHFGAHALVHLYGNPVTFYPSLHTVRQRQNSSFWHHDRTVKYACSTSGY